MSIQSRSFLPARPVVLLVAGLALWVEAANGEVVLELVTQGADLGNGITGTIVAEATRLVDGSAEERRFQVSVPGSTTLPLAHGTWRIRLESENLWAGESVETVPRENPITIKVWPVGEFTGEVATVIDRDSETQPPPLEDLESLQVNFSPIAIDSQGRGPNGTTLCPLSGTTFMCKLPSADLDIQLVADGYVPHFFWGLRVNPGETSKSGKVVLRSGASIAGWVVVEGDVGVEDVTIELSPFLLETPTNSRKREQMDRLRRSVTVDNRGFFQFAGIQPGQYIITAEKEGLAPSKATVQVDAGKHTMITDPPLTLSRPRTLEVFLDPPSPSTDQRWFLKFRRIDRGRRSIEEIARTSVDWTGSWESPGLASGRYQIAIGTDSENQWHVEEIEIGSTSDSHFISISIIEIRGSLQHGGEPLGAKLIFGGKHGSESISFESDDEGHFSGFLPRSGPWDVDIENQEQRIAVLLEEVDVSRRAGKTYADLQLRLDATRLQVSVVDSFGVPVQSLLTVQSLEKTGSPFVQKGSDSAGRAEFSALPKGRTRVSARARRVTPGGEEGLSARPMEVVLTEDRAEEVELVLLPQRKVSGRVMSGGFAVSGATVHIIPLLTAEILSSAVATDHEGQFEHEVPSDAKEFFAIVSAPGYSLKILGARIDEMPLLIEVQAGGGTLTIHLPDSSKNLLESSGRFQVVHKGGAIVLPYLFQWRQLHDRNPIQVPLISIPRMDPGEYRICLASTTEAFAGLLALEEALCESGYLSPGGSLVLKAPSE